VPRYRNHIQSPRSPLPCAPSPSTGEGLLGYKLRLADLNRFPSSTWIYDGPVAKTLLGGYEKLGPSDPLDQLAALTSLGRAELAKALLFPKKLYIRSLNLTRSRVCPYCLQEDPFLRKLWDVSLYVACHRHGYFLLDKCPACNVDVTWSRSRVCICDCGFDFRDAKCHAAEAAVISLMGRIAVAAEDVGTTEYCRQPSLNLQDCFPDLDLPLEELCTLIMFLGGLSIYGIRHKTFMQPRMIEVSYARSLVQHTADLFQDWPSSLVQVLKKAMKPQKKTEYAGLRARFGYMYMYLYNNMQSHHFDFLREVFEKYVRDNFVGHLGTGHFPMLSSETHLKPRYVTAKVAAKQLKISISEVRILVQFKTLPGVFKRDKSGRFLVFIEREALDRFVPNSRDYISLEAARKLLGLEKRQARELIKAEPFKTELMVSKNGGRSWKISRSRLDTLLSKLLSDLPYLKSCIPPYLTTIANYSKCYLNANGQVPLFLNAVLRGEIKPVGRQKGSIGITSLVFKHSEIRALVKSQNQLDDYRDIYESAKYLNLKKNYVFRLFKSGLLKRQMLPVGFRGKQHIRVSELDTFKKCFITMPELIRETGQPRMTLRWRLLQSGINPVRPPRPVPGGINVYRRNHAIRSYIESHKSRRKTSSKSRRGSVQPSCSIAQL
jgi:hypothetical protein